MECWFLLTLSTYYKLAPELLNQMIIMKSDWNIFHSWSMANEKLKLRTIFLSSTYETLIFTNFYQHITNWRLKFWIKWLLWSLVLVIQFSTELLSLIEDCLYITYKMLIFHLPHQHIINWRPNFWMKWLIWSLVFFSQFCTQLLNLIEDRLYMSYEILIYQSTTNWRPNFWIKLLLLHSTTA